jgi:hypothetical protein
MTWAAGYPLPLFPIRHEDRAEQIALACPSASSPDIPNDLRPHEALSQARRARHYEPSFRPMPDKPRTPEYDADMTVRWVAPSEAKENCMVEWLIGITANR